MKYKVGDRLKLVQRGNSTLNDIGSVIELTEVCGNSVKSRKISGHLGDRCTNWTTDYLDENFELVEEKGKPYTIKGKTYKPFDKGLDADELGIDRKRKFIVINPQLASGYGSGDIVKLLSACHLGGDFIKECGEKTYYIRWNELAYYDEETPLRVDVETVFDGSRWYGVSGAEQSLQIKANNLKPTGNKFMSNIVKFAKDAALAVSNPDEKLRREVGLKDESGNWTIEAKEIVMNLEAQALGFKGIEDFCNAMGVTTGSVFSTAFEAYNLLVKYDTQLLDIAKAKKAEDKK